METVKPNIRFTSNGTKVETLELILNKDLNPKYGNPISKGTRVFVEVETIRGEHYYSIKHPTKLNLYYSVRREYFLKHQLDDTPTPTSLKVGDEFWFGSNDSLKIWNDKIVKIDGEYAIFKKHPHLNKQYKIEVVSLEKHLANPSEDTWRGLQTSGAKDLVRVSKNKLDIQKIILNKLENEKRDKGGELSRLAERHAEMITEYEDIEKKEEKLRKEIEQQSVTPKV